MIVDELVQISFIDLDPPVNPNAREPPSKDQLADCGDGSTKIFGGFGNRVETFVFHYYALLLFSGTDHPPPGCITAEKTRVAGQERAKRSGPKKWGYALRHSPISLHPNPNEGGYRRHGPPPWGLNPPFSQIRAAISARPIALRPCGRNVMERAAVPPENFGTGEAPGSYKAALCATIKGEEGRCGMGTPP